MSVTSNTEKGENIVAFTWTVESLKEYFTTLMRESDRRYEERFIAQEKAVKEALTTTKEAIIKAENATERRFEGVNEFRKTLSDQTLTFMPRTEAIQRADANAEKIDVLSSRLDKMEARSGGLNAGWGYLIGAVGLVSGIIAIVFALNK